MAQRICVNYLTNVTLVTEHCEGGDINPTIVTDDEKQTYLTWGVQELWHVKLNKDMISYDPGIGIAQVPAEKRNWFAAEIRNTVNGTEKRSTTYEEGPLVYKRKTFITCFILRMECPSISPIRPVKTYRFPIARTAIRLCR